MNHSARADRPPRRPALRPGPLHRLAGADARLHRHGLRARARRSPKPARRRRSTCRSCAKTLGVGFDCTMVALIQSAMLVFLMHLAEEKEETERQPRRHLLPPQFDQPHLRRDGEALATHEGPAPRGQHLQHVAARHPVRRARRVLLHDARAVSVLHRSAEAARTSRDAEERSAARREARAARRRRAPRTPGSETAQATADQTLVAFMPPLEHGRRRRSLDWRGAATGGGGRRRNGCRAGPSPEPSPIRRDGLKASEGFWIWNSGEPNGFYRVYAELAGRQSGSDPVDVRISGACRFFNAKGEKSMALPVSGSFQLSRVGERVQVGAIEFDQTGSMKSFRWGAPAPGS